MFNFNHCPGTCAVDGASAARIGMGNCGAVLKNFRVGSHRFLSVMIRAVAHLHTFLRYY